LKVRVLPPAERRWLLAISIALLILTLLPLAAATVASPPGHVFGGFVYEARDGDSYVAKTMEGLEGHWVYHDPYTSEHDPPGFVFMPYILLGQLDRVLGLPVPLLLHLARLLLAGALLAALYLLVAEVFMDTARRRLAFLLTVLGGGLGFLAIGHAEILGYHYVTLDTAVSGATGIDTLNLAPHILLASLGSTWAAILWTRHQRHPTTARALGGLVWILLVSIAYPQLAAMWGVVGVVAWAVRPNRSSLVMAAAWIAGAIPYSLYGLYLRASNPVFANWPPTGDVDVGDALSFLVWAHVLMLPAAVTAVVALWHRRRQPAAGDGALGLMVAWLGVCAVLMYLPGLPAIMHRLFYASFVPFGVLAAAGLWSWAKAAKTSRLRRRILVYGTAAMCLTALQTAAEGFTIPLQHRNDLALYFPADEAAALTRLRALEPGGGGLVMNSYTSGLFVPAISGQITYIGFPFETLDLARKEANTVTFYQTADAAELRKQAAALGLDYVLWGIYERGLGGRDPGAAAGWKVVAVAGDARLYRVSAGVAARW
jgi:hypothetical protein